MKICFNCSDIGVKCTKYARGKTDFCVAHGGETGKKCIETECKSFAKGKTNFCF